MSILSSLTLSDATKRTENTDPKANLRRKMAASLDVQIAGANAEIAGQHYAVEVEKWFTTDPSTGTKERRKVQKVFRRMWFKDGTDRVMLELRFAGKPLLIAGKSSIVVGTVDHVVPAKLGRKLFDGYTGSKKLWEFPHDNHNDVFTTLPAIGRQLLQLWQVK